MRRLGHDLPRAEQIHGRREVFIVDVRERTNQLLLADHDRSQPDRDRGIVQAHQHNPARLAGPVGRQRHGAGHCRRTRRPHPRHSHRSGGGPPRRGRRRRDSSAAVAPSCHGDLPPVLCRFNDNHLRAPHARATSTVKQADRPGADDRHGFAGRPAGRAGPHAPSTEAGLGQRSVRVGQGMRRI